MASRTPEVELFDETVERCLNSTLEATLGRQVRDEVYRMLEKRGVSRSLVSGLFDRVVEVLRDAFGDGQVLLVHRTVAELYRTYSQPVDFLLGDSVRTRLLFLRNKVVSDHLHPRGLRLDAMDSFFDLRKTVSQSGVG